MKEIHKILKFYESLLKSSETACALAIVVYVEGSSYRRTGARMLISENGYWEGGISGGCLEGDALKKARMAIFKSKPNLVRYDTTTDEDYQIGVGLGCNGIIDVLFIPIDPQDPNNPIEILKHANVNNSLPLVTITKSEKNPDLLGKMFYSTSSVCFSFLEQLLNPEEFSKELCTLDKSKNYNFENETRLFVEILPKPINVFLFGNQYDIYPLIDLLKIMHWEVWVVTEPAKIRNLEGLNIIHPNDFLENQLNQNSAAILMSHSLENDKKNLEKIVRSDVKYIGMLGPKVRSERILTELKAHNIAFDSNKIFAPVGLDLGANTPEEIALSIAAEIKSVFNGRKGGFLKERELPINERNQEIFKFY